MSEPAKGFWAMFASATIWGFSALYYRLLDEVPASEVLCHRIIWSAVLLSALMIASGRIREIRMILHDKKALLIILLATILVYSNQLVYILAIQIGQLVQSSLGYFVYPLMMAALGLLILKERLNLLQLSGISFAVLAVVILTFGLGVVPGIALFLASTFAIYGLLKKQVNAHPLASVTLESCLAAPLAIGILFFVSYQGSEGASDHTSLYFGSDLYYSLLLPLAGPLTAVPLLTMSYATKRLTLSTVGLVGYWNPALQALIATVIFGEIFTIWHGLAFGLIWFACGLYSFGAWRQEKRGE